MNKDVNVQFTPEESVILADMVEMQSRLDYSEKEFWKYSQRFEKYDHGIMSAFLLVKNLRSMCNSSVRKTNMGEIKCGVSEFMKEGLKNQILTAVADHTCEYYRITDFSDQSSVIQVCT